MIEHTNDEEYRLIKFDMQHISNRNSYCILDFEATGANPQTDFITQIGAIRCFYNKDKGTLDMTNKYTTLVHSPIPLSEFISNLTHITNDELQYAPPFAEVASSLVDMIEGTTVITQGGYEFDFPLLDKMFIHHQLTLPSFNRVDIKVLFTWLHPEVKDIISTNYLLDFYQIDVSSYERHHALGDCHIIFHIFNRIITECKVRGIEHIKIENLYVRKFKL